MNIYLASRFTTSFKIYSIQSKT